MQRLVTAYQEDLLSLDELRRRMPELRTREQQMRAELQAILDQAADRITFLRLAETLTAFLQRLHDSAQSLNITDCQRIVRLLVKEILVDDNTITIRHSIPASPSIPPSDIDPPPRPSHFFRPDKSYLLRSGRDNTTLRGTAGGASPATHAPLAITTLFLDRCLEPHLDEA